MNPILFDGQFRLQRWRLTTGLWSITLVVWTVIAFFHYIQFYLEHVNSAQTFLWLQTLVEFIVNYYSWVPIAVFIVWVGRRYRIRKESWRRPLMLHILFSVIFACLHLWIIATVLRLMKPDAFPHLGLWATYHYAFLKLFHFEFLIYWAVLGLSYGFEHYSATQESEREESTKSPEYLMQLAVKNSGNTVLLRTARIDWMEAADNYISIHAGNNSYLLREKMHILENKLDPQYFRRIHRSTIVNLSRVKGVIRLKKSSYALLLQNGKRLTVSRRRREQLEHLITEIN